MRKHKLLAVLLALVMTLSILPTAALAAGGLTGEGTEANPYIVNQESLSALSTYFTNNASNPPADTIYLKAEGNISLPTSQHIVIPSGFAINLDFNGYTLTKSDMAGEAPIENYATLAVRDSSSGKTGGISGKNRCINNYATLFVYGGNYSTNSDNGGTAIRNSTADSQMRIYDCNIHASNFAVYNYGTMTVEGGTFVSTSCNHRNDFTYCFASEGTLNFKNGSVQGVQGGLAVNGGNAIIEDGDFKTVACQGSATNCQNGGSAFYALYIAGEVGAATAEIRGGTFTSRSKAAIHVGNDNTNGDGGINANATVVIKGGTFNGGGDHDLATGPVTGTPSIEGGTFNYLKAARQGTSAGMIEDYLADGYAIFETSGGKYTVEEMSDENCDARIGNKYYKTLPEAVNAATPGQTITLVRTTTGDGFKALADDDFTLDLNGNTYTINRTVGSAGTETNGTQFLKGAKVTIKNGAITFNNAEIGIKNYCDLKLDNVVLTSTSSTNPVINNCGQLVIDGKNTEIIASNTDWAITTGNYAKGDVITTTVNAGTISSIACETPLWETGGAEVTESVTTTINGGTIGKIGVYDWRAEYGGSYLNAPLLTNWKMNVNDGEFGSLDFDENSIGKVSISGGLFKTAPDSKYVAAPKSVVPSGNSSYPYAVGIGVSGVSLDKNTATIAVGETVDLTATVTPADATNKSVNWASSDTNVATVSGGTVTGENPGTATIKASVATIGGSKNASCEVTVLDKFTVKFESSQGTAPVALTVVQGETIDLPDAPEDVDTTVYVFNGWKLGDEIYQPTSVSEKAYTATGSVTFVAQWNKIVVPADPEGAGSTQIEVTTGEVNASVDVPEEQKEAAEQIAEDLAGTTVLDEEAEKAMTDAAEKLAQDQSVVDKALKDAEENGVTAGEDETRTVVVKTYMDVAVKSVEGNKAVLDITPKYDVIVSNGTKEHKAVEGEKLEVKADEKNPIVITLPLPEALKDMKSIFVRHETKDGTVYYYEAKIDKENGTITFANPHGFSEFTLLGGVETFVNVTRIGPNSTAEAGTDLGKMTLDMVGVEMNVSLGSGANVPSGKNWRFNGWTITATKSAVGEAPAETITLAEKVSAVNEETYYEMVDKAQNGYAITMDCLTPGLYVRSSGGSSSSSSSSYSVSLSSGKHGEVTASPKTASKGTTVTLTVKPDKGYELDKLTVTDKNGDNVKLTKKSDTQYTFTMPASKITVKAEFVEIEKAPAHAFTDVADGFWAEDAIVWAFEKGYMNGTSDTTFNPGGNVSRQQLWMILARVSGQNPANMAEAKSWAVDNGISDGTAPGGSVTRQQMVAILYRYATLMGYDVSAKADLGAYPDAASVAGYAKDAMAWSVANGIVGGTTQGTLNPAGTASRAQFAVILNRFCEKMA